MEIIGLLMSASLFGAITIDPASRTFDKAGGANSVLTAGDGTWTASANVDWITISPRTSGSAGESCVYIVNSNFSADTRVGKITIGGKVHTVTQTGYPATLDKLSENFTKTGGTGEIDVTVDNSISWTAKSNDSWITLTVGSGYGPGTVRYEVAPYTTSVVARSGSITIGGNTFVVVQSGPLVTITPSVYDLACDAKVLLVPIAALNTTTWMPHSNDSWITLVDAGSCLGDGTITLAIARNNGWIPRSGTVSVGDAVVTISQAQSPTFDFAIDPVNATADPKGAYGKVNVIAPSDSPWVAESMTSWITFSSGIEGAGNGTLGYVASANPTTSSRTGKVRFTPRMYSPDPDMFAGLLFRITSQSNIEGNESRSTTTSLSTAFNGNFNNPLTGTAIPAKDKNDFTFAFQFKVGELARINRLLSLNGTDMYLDNDNRLVLNSTRSSWAATSANAWYTVAIEQDASGHVSIYAGNKDSRLDLVLELDRGFIFNFSSSVAMSKFVLGSTTLPTSGYLTSGQMGNLRFWTRALTEKEIANVDVLQNTLFDTTPKYVPSGANWDMFSMDGHAYSTEESSSSPVRKTSSARGWTEFEDRFGLRQKAVCSTGGGKITITDFQSLFTGGSYSQNGSRTDLTGSYSGELSASYVFWIYVDTLPSSNVKIFERTFTGDSAKAFNLNYNYVLGLSLTSNGSLVVRQCDNSTSPTETTFSSVKIAARTWTMISFVGTDRQNIRIYVNDVEAGNVTSKSTFGWVPKNTYYYNNYGSERPGNNYQMVFGGWNGALDEVVFYHQALTSAQIRDMYEASRVKEIFHTVTQGIVDPELDTANLYVTAAGEVKKVNLTLPNNVNWTAQSNVGWIVIPTDTSGAGSCEISLNVTANPSVIERSGTVTIAGKTVHIYQRGLASSLEYDNKLIGTDGGSGNVQVYTEGNAAWTAVSDVSWISIATGASGAGNGSVMYVVDPYSVTSASRTGTITIAGKKLYITQRGYELSIDPAVREIGCNAGQGQFGISASIDVVWDAHQYYYISKREILQGKNAKNPP